jgi:5-(carboxyamino)imidazole ribonucleotide mutase
MPSGIPVATVAIDAAKNACILAAQILGTSNKDISNVLSKFKSDLALKVEKDNSEL